MAGLCTRFGVSLSVSDPGVEAGAQGHHREGNIALSTLEDSCNV